jgi:hypothetical protein
MPMPMPIVQMVAQNDFRRRVRRRRRLMLTAHAPRNKAPLTSASPQHSTLLAWLMLWHLVQPILKAVTDGR